MNCLISLDIVNIVLQLQSILPERSDLNYNLRPRPHNLVKRTKLIDNQVQTINVSDHQYEATLSCDGQKHALLTVPLLLQDLLRGTYFQFLSETPTRMLLFVVNSKLTYFPHQIDYLICAAYIVCL